jgi:hypothetical protein
MDDLEGNAEDVWESAEAERCSTSEQAETGLNVGESVG